MVITLLALLGIAAHVFVAYHGYKFGKKYGHKWIGLVAASVLYMLLLGPLFFALISRLVKPAAGVGSA